jgi:hypothetical protein
MTLRLRWVSKRRAASLGSGGDWREATVAFFVFRGYPEHIGTEKTYPSRIP